MRTSLNIDLRYVESFGDNSEDRRVADGLESSNMVDRNGEGNRGKASSKPFGAPDAHTLVLGTI